ncbi:hypothetical protein [Devosia sp. Root635]|uniref:hypothetical protein n=1 Tax=Devosia sp. Root635 TaxID=1736575 RepID=UPI0006FA5D15|nr:hypothetical protein [Devosia sp. Root635]KRA50216.1 hypothetical protein ASD80_16825 [Devosia sp. Root635]
MFPQRFESQEQADRSYIACGMIAVNWGGIEGALEAFIILLRSRHRAELRNGFPVSFSKKAEEAKSRMGREPTLADERNLLSLQVTKAKPLHRIRVHVTHGTFQGMRLDGTLAFGVSDMARGYSYIEHKYTPEQLTDHAREMSDLGREMIDLFGNVRKKLASEQS